MNWGLFIQLNAEFIETFMIGSVFMLLAGMIVTIIAVMRHENIEYKHYLEDVYSGMYTGE